MIGHDFLCHLNINLELRIVHNCDLNYLGNDVYVQDVLVLPSGWCSLLLFSVAAQKTKPSYISKPKHLIMPLLINKVES